MVKKKGGDDEGEAGEDGKEGGEVICSCWLENIFLKTTLFFCRSNDNRNLRKLNN